MAMMLRAVVNESAQGTVLSVYRLSMNPMAQNRAINTNERGG